MSTHSDENDKVLKDMYLALKPRTDSDTTINSVYPGPTRKTFDKFNETYYFQNGPSIKGPSSRYIEEPKDPEHQQAKEFGSTDDLLSFHSASASGEDYDIYLDNTYFGQSDLQDNATNSSELIRPQSGSRPPIANADNKSIASGFIDSGTGLLEKDQRNIQSMMKFETEVGEGHTLQRGAGTTGDHEDPRIISLKPKGMFRPLLHHSKYGVAKTASEESFFRRKYMDNENVSMFRQGLRHSTYGVRKTPSEESYFRGRHVDNKNVESYKTNEDEPEWIHPENFLRPMVANADTLSITSAYVDISPGFLAKDQRDVQSMTEFKTKTGEAHLVYQPHTLQGGAGTTGKDEDPCIISKKPKAMFGPLLHHSRFGVAKTQSEENYLRGRYFDNENVDYYKADEDETGCVDTRNMDELAEAVLEMERLAHQYRSSDQLSDFQDPGCCSVQSIPSTEEIDLDFLKADDRFNGIIRKTFEAFVQARALENKMLQNVFKDLNVSQWKDMLIQHWLPRIQKSTKRHFASYDRPAFFREAYYLIQYFHFGFSQMMNDQLPTGAYLVDYEKMSLKCKGLLDEYLQAMKAFQIANYSSVQPSVMPPMYRDIKVKICRDLRDYIILTQFIKGCSYLCRGFCYLLYEFTL